MAGSSGDSTVDKEAQHEVSKGSVDFTLSLYKALSESQSGNIITSPLSLQIILALAYFGARGNTAKQIASGLRLPADDTVIQNGFRSILLYLKGNKNYTLELANKVFPQSGFAILQKFQEVAQRSFFSETKGLDFSKKGEAAAAINKWVEKKTKNKIKNLISSDMLDSLTRLILVNAVYFKGKWEHQFKKKHTSSEPFYISATEKKNVDMMHIKKEFNYADLRNLDAQILELSYIGNQLSMFILLPNQKDGIKKLEEKLPTVNMAEIVSSMYDTEVNVSLPKFKLEQNIDMDPLLKGLGITEMYENNADFSGITDAEDLNLSKVVQKAFIEVNEVGSEAAAATNVRYMCRAKRPRDTVKEFHADHPFIFILGNLKEQIVLFIGKLNTVS